MAVINKKSFKIKSIDKDISLPKNIEKIDFKIDDYDKGKYKYFMHKEIHEQINTIPNTINGRIKNESVFKGPLGGKPTEVNRGRWIRFW